MSTIDSFYIGIQCCAPFTPKIKGLRGDHMVTDFSFPETRRIMLSNEPLMTTVAVVVFAGLANVTDRLTDVRWFDDKIFYKIMCIRATFMRLSSI